MVYSIVLILLILLSAFFSSAETSLLSINKSKLRHSKKKKDKRADILLKILNEPDYFFSTILIGNNLVNIAAASLSTILISRYFVNDEELLMFYSTFITTILILVFAEIIPKSYAIRESRKLAYIYAWPLRFFMIIFYLPSKAFALLSYFLFKNKTNKEKGLDIDEFKVFLESEAKFLKYQPDTLKMIHEVIDIASKDAKSVMTPRMKMFALDVSLEYEELKHSLLNNNYNKIPVYENDLDSIVGIFEVNSLVKKVLLSDSKDFDIRSLAVEPFFVSEYSSLDYIMEEFKSRKVNIAVVLDEYASVAGIVTINDIFRELMGGFEIKSIGVKKRTKNSWFIKGDANVLDVNNYLNISLPLSKEYSSLGGLFIYTHGSLPVKGDKLSIGDYSLTVSATDKKTVRELKLNIGVNKNV